MALTTHSQTKKIFLQIVGGKFAQKVDKGTQGSIERKNKKEATVYELLHDRVSGFIKEIKVEKNDFGKQIVIVMDEIGETYVITLPVDSKYSDSFVSKIGNADLSQTVELAPYSFSPKDNTGKRIGMNIYQNGNKLDYYFSKENPKGKPFPQGEKLDEDDWRMYKILERKFYCEYIEKLTSVPLNSQKPKIENLSNQDLPF